MRARTTAATTALLLAALTACGGSSGSSADPRPSATAAPKTSAKKVDCKDQSIDQATWVKYCSKEGAGTGGDGTTSGASGKTMTLGKTAQTIGAQTPADGGPGGGALEVTPTTVVYAKTAMGNTSANGVYAIITVKDRAPNAVAAVESAPLEGGGWQWIAADGQALDEGENDASSITPNGFTGGGTIQAGTYHWRTIAFDLTEAQRGGTIAYTDGEGTVFRWKVPATNSGPEVAALKKGMEGNY